MDFKDEYINEYLSRKQKISVIPWHLHMQGIRMWQKFEIIYSVVTDCKVIVKFIASKFEAK